MMGCLDSLPPYGLGIVLVLGSAAAFSVMSLLVHMLSNSFGTFTIAATRFIIQSLFACAWMQYTGPKNGWFGHPDNRWPLVSRGVFGFLGMTAYYFSLGHLPLGEATAIMFTNPVLTAGLAWLLLGESFGWVEAISLIASFAGILCIARPPGLFGEAASKHEPSGGAFGRAGLDFGRSWNLVINGLGALFAASSFISLRMLKPKEPAPVPTLYMGLFGGVCATIMAGAVEGVQLPPQTWPYVLLVLVGTMGFAGQLMLNRGFQLVEAAVGATMRNLDVALAFIFQATILGEHFSWWSLLGATLIMSCTALVAWNRTRKKSEDGDKGDSSGGSQGAGEGEGDGAAAEVEKGGKGVAADSDGRRGKFSSISQAAARYQALEEEEDEEALVNRGEALDLEILSVGSDGDAGQFENRVASNGTASLQHRSRGGSGVLDASYGGHSGAGVMVLGDADSLDSRLSSEDGIELVDGALQAGAAAPRVNAGVARAGDIAGQGFPSVQVHRTMAPSTRESPLGRSRGGSPDRSVGSDVDLHSDNDRVSAGDDEGRAGHGDEGGDDADVGFYEVPPPRRNNNVD